MYDPKSLKAEEFIDHEEILSTIEYAEQNKNNRELIEQILERQNQRRKATDMYVRAYHTERQVYCLYVRFQIL